jgi:hypothetical protein
MPDIQEATTRAASNAQVELAALVNPIEEWAQVFQTAFVNATAIGSRIAADPAPILAAIANNQAISAEFLAGFGLAFGSAYLDAAGDIPANVAAALALIEQGNIQQGVQDLLLGLTVTPVLSALLFSGLILQLPDVAAVLSNPFDNISRVINTGLSIGTLFNLAPLLVEPFAPALQLGVTAQQVYDAVEADDFEAAVNALISFPSQLVNTTVNGNPLLGNGGLLGDFGIVNALLNLRDAIAPVITPPVISTPISLSDTFNPSDASDTGLQGGQLVSLGADTESTFQQQNSLSAGPVETKKVKDVDEVTNTGATVALVSQTAGTSTGSNGAKVNKPGERLRVAFEGTFERIEKGFDDAVKGFDNALKGLGGRDKADKGGADTAGADAGAGEATSTGS